jgi:hypothetical protein
MCLAWRTLWGVRVLGTLGSQIRKNYQAAAPLSTFALSTRTRTTFPISLHIPSVFATLSPRLLYSVSPFHICIYLLSRSCLQHCLQIFLNQWLVHMPKVFINSMRKTTSHFCRTFILFRIARRTPFKWNSKSARSWLTQPAISRTRCGKNLLIHVTRGQYPKQAVHGCASAYHAVLVRSGQFND